MRQMQMQEQQRQQEEWMRQQQYLQQQQQQQYQQQQSLLAQPTGYGSNNPFAPQQQQQQPAMPSFSQSSSSSFLPVPSVTPQQAPTPAKVEPQQTAQPFRPAVKKDDGQHAGLANLLARGREDGLDTFGNTGNLRESCSRPGDSMLTSRYTRRKQLPPVEPRRTSGDRARCQQPVRSGAATAAEAKRPALLLYLILFVIGANTFETSGCMI